MPPQFIGWTGKILRSGSGDKISEVLRLNEEFGAFAENRRYWRGKGGETELLAAYNRYFAGFR
jgi:hypothetical protein